MNTYENTFQPENGFFRIHRGSTPRIGCVYKNKCVLVVHLRFTTQLIPRQQLIHEFLQKNFDSAFRFVFGFESLTYLWSVVWSRDSSLFKLLSLIRHFSSGKFHQLYMMIYSDSWNNIFQRTTRPTRPLVAQIPNFLEFTWIHLNLVQFTWICLNLLKFAWICLNPSFWKKNPYWRMDELTDGQIKPLIEMHGLI